MTPAYQRFAIIDWLRAFAILLMIIYHFAYDLRQFGFIAPDTFNHIILLVIGRGCLCLFMFCVGYSLAIAHTDGIQWKKFFKRWVKVALAAGLVSLATFISHPQYWIYFGILHCIAISSLIALPFLRIPLIALVAGIAMMTAFWGWGAYLPWIHLNRPSLDYIPVFPWMGPVLMGIGMHYFKLHEYIQAPYSKLVEFLSRRSMEIYLIHQPILMGIVWSLAKMAGPRL